MEQIIKKYIDSFLGYGNPKNPFWFIGMEEGAAMISINCKAGLTSGMTAVLTRPRILLILQRQSALGVGSLNQFPFNPVGSGLFGFGLTLIGGK